MKEYNKKNKHMTFDDRQEIQDGLNLGMIFKDIAKRIRKDQTTVSKEVKKHIDIRDNGVVLIDESQKNVAPEVCSKLLKAPFVCNPCRKRHSRCKYRKQFYNARKAQSEYEALRSESREGIPLNKESFYDIDCVVTKGVKQGQHLYHIMQTNDLGVSKSTLYRHLKRGYLSVAPIDFPRVVKFKERRSRSTQFVPKALKAGRTYDDFISRISDNSITSWVEMDTVIGRIGGKAVLTFDFTFCNFMFGMLLDNKSALDVTNKIANIKSNLKSIGTCFGYIFPLILTDNGGEFANIHAIENSIDGDRETHLFFCDPNRSYQKPRVEKNHTLFRDIVPKGTSFDDFTQDTIDLIFSHVNSIKRKSLNGRTSYEVFVFTFGVHIAKALGVFPVPADEVIQSPKLLK